MTYPSEEPYGSGTSTTDVARGEAANVKDTAVEAGKNVAATAKDEATNVAAETKEQAKSLISSVTSEVQQQAGTQQQKIASAVHSMSKELSGMASGSTESGPLTDLAHQAARKGGDIANFLESRKPADVLAEVTSFARRRPVMFLALCGLAGVVAGRITRGAVAANTDVDSPSPSPAAADYPGGRQPLASVPTYEAHDLAAAPAAPAPVGAPASMVEELPTTYEDSWASDADLDPSPGFGQDPAAGRSDAMR